MYTHTGLFSLQNCGSRQDLNLCLQERWEKIPGSRWSTRGYILTYSRHERENIRQLRLLTIKDLNFCIHSTLLERAATEGYVRHHTWLPRATGTPVESADEGEGVADTPLQSNFLVDVANINNNNGPEEDNVYGMDMDIDENGCTIWSGFHTHTHPSAQVSKRCPSFVRQFWVCASEENGFQHKCHIFFWSFTWIFPSSVFWFVSFVYTLHVLYNNVVSCPCTASKCRGLSFHGLPKDVIGTKTNQEWRSQLVHAINHANSSFNPDKAKICSRHFTEDCFRYMVWYVLWCLWH